VKRVLVTGASGFIGRHSLRFLVEQGYEVHAVARGAVPPTDLVTAHSCDLLDDRATAALIRAVRPTHLLHFAWYAIPGKFWTAPENLDWAAASLRLLRTFADSGGRRAVCAGSCAEYDWSEPLLSETTTKLAPRTLYGTAKNAVRSCLEHAAATLGLDWAWGRVFFLYGPHEAPGRLVSDVVAALVAGNRIAVSAGLQQRDFLHVEDVARSFVTVLDSDLQGALNIAAGRTVAVRDVVERIGALTGRAELIDIGGRAAPPHDPAALAAGIDRLTTLGFTPRYDLTAGLAQTVEWWRSRAGA
jgi:nucleoside-diphosphate-sugar epimerase